MIDGSQFGFVGMNMKRYRLGEICEIVSGSTPKTSIQEYWDGDIKWITPAEITDDSYIITDTVRKITKLGVEKNGLSSFPAGTVILSSRAPIGKVAIAGCDMYCNQGFKNLICSKIINNKYLYWFLKGKKDYLNKLGRGATFKEISKQIVAEIEIELPSLEEQVLVANNLLNIKRVIDLKKKEIDLFDKLIKARFVEMFGAEDNPFHWDIINVEEIANVSVGVVIKPAQYYTDSEHGVKAFRSLNIGPMCVKDNDWVYFSPEGHAKNQKSQLCENDLLIVRSGAPGTSCVVTKKFEGCNAIDIIIARPNIERINPYYLCAYTNLPHGKKQIEEGTGGAAQQHFNVGKFNKLNLFLPPLRLQNQFANFVTQIDKSKVVYLKAARKYHKQSKVVEMKMSQC